MGTSSATGRATSSTLSSVIGIQLSARAHWACRAANRAGRASVLPRDEFLPSSTSVLTGRPRTLTRALRAHRAFFQTLTERPRAFTGTFGFHRALRRSPAGFPFIARASAHRTTCSHRRASVLRQPWRPPPDVSTSTGTFGFHGSSRGPTEVALSVRRCFAAVTSRRRPLVPSNWPDFAPSLAPRWSLS